MCSRVAFRHCLRECGQCHTSSTGFITFHVLFEERMETQLLLHRFRNRVINPGADGGALAALYPTFRGARTVPGVDKQ